MHFSPTLLPSLTRILGYLDPGSGSLILQMLIAALVGGGLLLRTFWGRITGKGRKSKDDLDEADEDKEDKRS